MIEPFQRIPEMADDKTEYTDDESLASVGSTVDVTDEDAESIELNLDDVTAQLEADLAEAKDAALRAILARRGRGRAPCDGGDGGYPRARPLRGYAQDVPGA